MAPKDKRGSASFALPSDDFPFLRSICENWDEDELGRVIGQLLRLGLYDNARNSFYEAHTALFFSDSPRTLAGKCRSTTVMAKILNGRLTKSYVKMRILAAAFAFLVAVIVPCHHASAQLSTSGRPPGAYHSDHPLDPATLMSQERFSDTAGRGYVVVEGYIDYVAGQISTDGKTTKVVTEADGDFHFEMQSTNAQRPPGESPNGLVCEIDPAWQLNGWNALSQISRKNPATYRRVRVYGWLRFGSELGHSGTRTYQYSNGRSIKGHWEIHPVEYIEAIDGREPFRIGPAAKVSSWPIAQRYRVTNATFAKAGPSNYAKLTGKIERIAASADKSGDVDVWVRTAPQRRYVATVPQYYILHFDPAAQIITFLQLPNFAAVHYSLQPSKAKTRTLYGLRNWKFSLGSAFPALQPVELIR